MEIVRDAQISSKLALVLDYPTNWFSIERAGLNVGHLFGKVVIRFLVVRENMVLCCTCVKHILHVQLICDFLLFVWIEVWPNRLNALLDSFVVDKKWNRSWFICLLLGIISFHNLNWVCWWFINLYLNSGGCNNLSCSIGYVKLVSVRVNEASLDL